MPEVFRPIGQDNKNVPRVIRYRTRSGENVVVKFGTELGLPAMRFTVRDKRGRVLRDGGSIALSHEYSLTAGLGFDSARGIKILRHLSNP